MKSKKKEIRNVINQFLILKIIIGIKKKIISFIISVYYIL